MVLFSMGVDSPAIEELIEHEVHPVVVSVVLIVAPEELDEVMRLSDVVLL